MSEPSLLRRCSDCGEEKPYTSEHFRSGATKGTLRKLCRPCDVRRACEWRKRNPEKAREQRRLRQKRLRDRARAVMPDTAQGAFRALLGQAILQDGLSADALRRMMVEHPLPPDTEGERLAFYRGFLIGRERKEREEERFKEYQDLAYRIASELDRKYRGVPDRLSYEDLISHAYEAVLEIIRKKRAPERSEVASCIRNRIKDAYRVQFGREGFQTVEKRNTRGKQYVDVFDGEETWVAENQAAPRADGSEELLESVRLKAAQKFGSDHRFLEMLELRFQGLTYKEIGERFGLTESRTCQLFKDQEAWMEEALLPLAAG